MIVRLVSVIAECFLFLQCSGFAGSSQEQISFPNSVGASPAASVSNAMMYQANPIMFVIFLSFILL